MGKKSNADDVILTPSFSLMNSIIKSQYETLLCMKEMTFFETKLH